MHLGAGFRLLFLVLESAAMFLGDALPGRKQMTEDNLVQLYWAILERWGAQVDSYWTRTNYFVLFVTAAIGGTWVVLGETDESGKEFVVKGHVLLIADLAVLLAIVLTAAWIFSNLKSYDYHMYWWNVLKEIERNNGWGINSPDYVSEYEARRTKRSMLSKFQYHTFTNWVVPIGFFVFWVGLIESLVAHRLN